MTGTDDTLRRLARAPCPRPTHPTHRATVRNRYCADVLTVTLQTHGDRVVAAGWHGDACLWCKAGATQICTALTGHPLAHLDTLQAALTHTAQGQPTAPFEAFAALAATPGRESCVQLGLTAAREALHPTRTQTPTRPTSRPHRSPHHLTDPWEVVQHQRSLGLDVVVVTLIDVVGSSPCPVGSHMVVSSDGSFWGAVSGGCVESSIVQAAQQLLTAPGAAPAQLLTFQIANSQADEAGLPCGGELRVHLCLAPGDRLVRAYRARGNGLARVVDLAGGREAIESSAAQQPQLQGTRFVQPLNARDTLVLVGGTRVAQVLAQLAVPLDVEVHVLEPRPGFSTPDRFDPTVTVHTNDPAHALVPLLGPRTAVVVLAHDARLDDPVLVQALTSQALYVGALGSRKTQRARLQRLQALGVPTKALHGPAGLALGAQGPAEIALSILAEIVRARRAATPPRSVGAVVLAAGSSRRAGPANKLLQPFHGQPLVRATVRAVLDAGVGPCWVVLGHQAQAVQEALADLPVRFVTNPDHEQGMGTSLALGMQALASQPVSAAMVALGDMPYVRAEDLRTLISAHTTATQHLPIVPVAGEGAQRRRGNPVIWPRRLFDALMQCSGDVGGKPLLRQAGGAVLEVNLEHRGVLEDVDGLLPPTS